MKPLSDFLPFVLPYVSGCTDAMAEQAILSACIEFAGKSCIVQYTQAESSVAGQADYDVEEPAQMTLVRTLLVFYNSQKLDAVARAMLTNAMAARGESIGGDDVELGTPREWVMRDPAQPIVSLYPRPAASEVGAITIVSAYQPTRAATRVADILYDDYAADIGAGAVGMLLMMPNQQFSAPAFAKPFKDQFQAAISTATALARTGLGTGSLRVTAKHAFA